jgi:hypothetical protein
MEKSGTKSIVESPLFTVFSFVIYIWAAHTFQIFKCIMVYEF